MSTYHSMQAERFLEDKAKVKWHNETLWHVREKRDRMSKSLPEWEKLRMLASEVKMHTITHLETYLEQFSRNAESNGVVVHWAKDADEHNRIIHEILSKHSAKKVVKSKSMLTEECHLNHYLEQNGIEVVESDLGERILQLMNQPPSHIVLPAIHLKRQEIGTLFEEKMSTERGNSDPTYLTHEARQHLRNEFLTADAALTGANFGVASSGDIVVCTNEGNADMGTSLSKLHIVSMGIEKLVPNLESLSLYVRLLARSATGQPITTYTSHYRRPQGGGELHVVLVDNGRSHSLGNKHHWQTLKCIRCGACMNTCPVYRRSGGYSYSYFIPGPIGINLGMLKSPKNYFDNLSACTLCYSCNDVCPVKIDLAGQIYHWRQSLDSYGKASNVKKMLAKGMGLIFENPTLYGRVAMMAPFINKLPSNIVYSKLNSWGIYREMPPFAKESFTSMWKKGKVQQTKE